MHGIFKAAVLYFVQPKRFERDNTMGNTTSDNTDINPSMCDGDSCAATDRVSKAMDMARHYHFGQKRRGSVGESAYFDEHIMGVYNILRCECGVKEEDILIIALLHDTVEDTACTLLDIEREFGLDIRSEVDLLTRVEGEPFSVYSRRLFSNASYKTVLVKLADRLHNLRTIVRVPDPRWIQKKVKQSYTDILNPLPEAMSRIDGRYNDTIRELADKIEDQILEVQRFLNLTHS